MELLLATRNRHKTGEFAQLLGRNFTLRDLTTEHGVPEIRETGRTFEENAVIKAVKVSKMFPRENVIADDSGLEVDALGGSPGIFSARYAGEAVNDRRNVEKLLHELWRNFPSRGAGGRQVGNLPHFSARFRCVLALAKNGELITTVAGEVIGSIAESPRGENGFGYDPIFVPDGFKETFAELSTDTKNAISHRARAVHELFCYFNTARRSGEK